MTRFLAFGLKWLEAQAYTSLKIFHNQSVWQLSQVFCIRGSLVLMTVKQELLLETPAVLIHLSVGHKYITYLYT